MSKTTEPGSHCLNCGTALTGQYCGHCGQRASTRLISVWELLRDAFGDLFELDSRLWRTLLPLLARPGRLTQDYLEGRRARYMPPFRMYLVFSLIFFVVAFFDPNNDLDILFGVDPDTATDAAVNEPQGPAPSSADRRREIRQAVDELVNEGILDESLVGSGKLIDLPANPADSAPDGPARDGTAADAVPQPGGNGVTTGDDPANLRVTLAGDAGFDCNDHSAKLDTLPNWVKRRLTQKRIERICERWLLDGADGFVAATLDKVPAALLLLLPLMAVVMKGLYPLSRRYYVEHLLFFVHLHAFLFLILTLQILWSRAVGSLGLAEPIAILPVLATSLYIPVYLFMSMRQVYGQSRFLTFLKFSTLTTVYTVGFVFVLLGTLFFAALSI